MEKEKKRERDRDRERDVQWVVFSRVSKRDCFSRRRKSSRFAVRLNCIASEGQLAAHSRSLMVSLPLMAGAAREKREACGGGEEEGVTGGGSVAGGRAEGAGTGGALLSRAGARRGEEAGETDGEVEGFSKEEMARGVEVAALLLVGSERCSRMVRPLRFRKKPMACADQRASHTRPTCAHTAQKQRQHQSQEQALAQERNACLGETLLVVDGDVVAVVVLSTHESDVFSFYACVHAW